MPLNYNGFHLSSKIDTKPSQYTLDHHHTKVYQILQCRHHSKKILETCWLTGHHQKRPKFVLRSLFSNNNNNEHKSTRASIVSEEALNQSRASKRSVKRDCGSQLEEKTQILFQFKPTRANQSEFIVKMLKMTLSGVVTISLGFLLAEWAMLLTCQCCRSTSPPAGCQLQVVPRHHGVSVLYVESLLLLVSVFGHSVGISLEGGEFGCRDRLLQGEQSSSLSLTVLFAVRFYWVTE